MVALWIIYVFSINESTFLIFDHYLDSEWTAWNDITIAKLGLITFTWLPWFRLAVLALLFRLVCSSECWQICTGDRRTVSMNVVYKWPKWKKSENVSFHGKRFPCIDTAKLNNYNILLFHEANIYIQRLVTIILCPLTCQHESPRFSIIDLSPSMISFFLVILHT